LGIVNAPELAWHQIKRFQKSPANAAKLFHMIVDPRDRLDCGDGGSGVFDRDNIGNGLYTGAAFTGLDQPPIIHRVLPAASESLCPNNFDSEHCSPEVSKTAHFNKKSCDSFCQPTARKSNAR
jgi:hypothetical protein